MLHDEVADRIEQALAAANLPTKGTELGANGRSGLVRLVNRSDQLKAQDVVRDALGTRYVVAQNLAQTTPDWLSAIGAGPMTLGLDLSGGVHFLLQVDMDNVSPTGLPLMAVGTAAIPPFAISALDALRRRCQVEL